jgi:hypothetical protein
LRTQVGDVAATAEQRVSAFDDQPPDRPNRNDGAASEGGKRRDGAAVCGTQAAYRAQRHCANRKKSSSLQA